MAIVQEPFWTLTVSFQDRDLNKGSVQLYIAATVLLADIITAVTTLVLPRIAAISDATIIGWSVNRSAYENAVVLAPETSDVERKGTFTFRTDTNRPVTMQVPSIRNSMVTDRTNQILLNDSAVLSFTEMIIDGAILGAVRPVSVTGEDVTILVNAYKRHRRSQNG